MRISVTAGTAAGHGVQLDAGFLAAGIHPCVKPVVQSLEAGILGPAALPEHHLEVPDPVHFHDVAEGEIDLSEVELGTEGQFGSEAVDADHASARRVFLAVRDGRARCRVQAVVQQVVRREARLEVTVSRPQDFRQVCSRRFLRHDDDVSHHDQRQWLVEEVDTVRTTLDHGLQTSVGEQLIAVRAMLMSFMGLLSKVGFLTRKDRRRLQPHSLDDRSLFEPRG
jgi:hypothetical protein